eukprot:1550429-Rhodomonas_salina.1
MGRPLHPAVMDSLVVCRNLAEFELRRAAKLLDMSAEMILGVFGKIPSTSGLPVFLTLVCPPVRSLAHSLTQSLTHSRSLTVSLSSRKNTGGKGTERLVVALALLRSVRQATRSNTQVMLPMRTRYAAHPLNASNCHKEFTACSASSMRVIDATWRYTFE